MKHVAWSLGNALLSKGFSFVFTIIIGNLLLPEQLGLFVTLLLVVTYAANIFSLNLGGGIVQKMNSLGLSQDPGRFFTAGALAVAVLSATALLVFYLLSDSLIRLFDIPRARDVIYMTYPLLVLTMFRSYFTHVYQAELRFKPLALINMSAAGVQIMVTLILLFLGMDLKGVFWGLYSSSLVALVPLAYQSFRRFGMVINRETLYNLKKLTAFSSIIFIGSIAVLLDQRIDMIFVAHFLDNQDVAVYDYVLKFALLFVLFGASISKVTYPRFTRAFSSQSNDISRILNFSLNYTFFFLTIIGLIFFLHAELIIGLILPDFYLQLIPYLLILLIGVIPKSVVTSVGTLFTAKGLPSVSLWVNWLLLAVNVTLNVLLIPRYGLYGAAIATTTSFLLKPLIMLFLIARKLRVTYTYRKLSANFFLFMVVLVGGHYVESYAIREIILVFYLLYSYHVFLNKTEKQYLLSGWHRFNSRIIQFVRS